MGEAKRRGTYEERKAAAIKREQEKKEAEEKKQPSYNTNTHNWLKVAIAAGIGKDILVIGNKKEVD